jgi:hypothetical protein
MTLATLMNRRMSLTELAVTPVRRLIEDISFKRSGLEPHALVLAVLIGKVEDRPTPACDSMAGPPQDRHRPSERED